METDIASARVPFSRASRSDGTYGPRRGLERTISRVSIVQTLAGDQGGVELKAYFRPYTDHGTPHQRSLQEVGLE